MYLAGVADLIECNILLMIKFNEANEENSPSAAPSNDGATMTCLLVIYSIMLFVLLR